LADVDLIGEHSHADRAYIDDALPEE